MVNKLMYIPNEIHKITLSVGYSSSSNVWAFNLMSQPIKIQVPKVVEPTNKKRYYKTLGTSAINVSHKY